MPSPKPHISAPGEARGGAGFLIAERLRRLPLRTKLLTLVAADALAWLFALLTLTALRYDFGLTDEQWVWSIGYTLLAMVLQLLLATVTHTFRGRSRIGSFDEASLVGGLVFLVAIPLGLVLAVAVPEFPRAVGLMVPPLVVIFMSASRGLYRMLQSRGRLTNGVDDATPVLVYGAGDGGQQVAQLVDNAINPPYRIMGFIDDDPGKKNLRVRDFRVLGTGETLLENANKLGVETVILAISHASPQLIQRVSKLCTEHGLELIIIPPVREMIGGRVSLGALRPFNVADFLGRRPIKTDVRSIADYIMGKRVLITGAGGSIGSELARQVHKLGPARLALLDRDESELHAVRLSIDGNGLLDTDDMVLCDIRDTEALDAVFAAHRPEVVFHAAALKHLPMLERFPMEGWKTNVLGTRNVLEVSEKHGVAHFVNVSTDKAADATSVLGRSKRLGERMTSWHATEHGLKYLSVRFGNVLGSRGSVLYTFRAQIDRGGPVTVTDPDVTRFFMTIPEACELVLQAGAIGEPGDVLVLDMGEPVKIVDVAERLIAESGKEIEIHYTGLRHGEKLHEVLFSASEDHHESNHPLISTVRVPGLKPVSVPEKPASREEVLVLLDHDTDTSPTLRLVSEEAPLEADPHEVHGQAAAL